MAWRIISFVYHPQFFTGSDNILILSKLYRINIYALKLLEGTGNILHEYLWIFPMGVEMANIATKQLSWYDGSMNAL